jgi:glycosyltransferase involved in cell wall biosynthesis
MYCFISTMEGAPWGGSEELWTRTALEFIQQGIPVYASVKHWDVMPAQLMNLRSDGVGLISRKFREKNDVEDHIKELIALKPRLTVLSTGDNGQSVLPWLKILRNAGLRYVLIFQCSAAWWGVSDQKADEIIQYFDFAEQLFFVSNQNLTETENMLGKILQNASVVWNPVKIKSRVAFSWPECDVPRFACVGRLDMVCKGQDILLSILNQHKWRARNLQLSLYGEGLNRKILERRVKQSNLTNIVFRGFAEIENIWKREQILLLPSRAEGMPLALLEALSVGRPAVVTDVGGSADVVKDGVTGFIAKAATVGQVEEAMEKAWQCRDKWKEMGVAASVFMREEYPANPERELRDRILAI